MFPFQKINYGFQTCVLTFTNFFLILVSFNLLGIEMNINQVNDV